MKYKQQQHQTFCGIKRNATGLQGKLERRVLKTARSLSFCDGCIVSTHVCFLYIEGLTENFHNLPNIFFFFLVFLPCLQSWFDEVYVLFCMAMNIRRNCSILSLRKLILIGLKPTMLVLIPLTVISLGMGLVYNSRQCDKNWLGGSKKFSLSLKLNTMEEMISFCF